MALFAFGNEVFQEKATVAQEGFMLKKTRMTRIGWPSECAGSLRLFCPAPEPIPCSQVGALEKSQAILGKCRMLNARSEHDLRKLFIAQTEFFENEFSVGFRLRRIARRIFEQCERFIPRHLS